ncbi:MAG: hypothetical protein V5A25_05885 [Halovenus sp.]
MQGITIAFQNEVTEWSFSPSESLSDGFELSPSDIIDENEVAGAAFVSPGGLDKAGGDGPLEANVPVLLVVTDRRLLFAAVPNETVEETIAFAYSDLASVEIRGDDGRRIELTTVSDSNWRYQFPPGNPEARDTIRRHLLWVGEIRRRVVSTRNDIEFRAGKIRDHAREMEWAECENRYDEARRSLDRLIGAVQRTEPIDDDVLAPELTEIERTLEKAAAWLYIERAESQLELGRQLVGTENYGQAQKVLAQARTHYETATGHSDTVRRGDAFQFGEQRDLQEALDRIDRELHTVATEPFRQADEAKTQAQDADEPEAAVEYWESAFRRYGQILRMNWDRDGSRSRDDFIVVYDELEAAAEAIVRLRTGLAHARWEEAVSSRQRGEPKAALRSCGEARDHLERAHELAAEFDVGDADGIATRLQRIRDVLADVREEPTGEEQGASIDEELPSAAELNALDMQPEEDPVGTQETGGDDDGPDADDERDAESTTTE